MILIFEFDSFFYTVNKYDLKRINGEVLPKYTIVRRVVSSLYKDKFKPDHDALWYFKSRQSAEWLTALWKKQDTNENI